MSEHEKFDFTQMRQIAPEEYERVMREMAKEGITITGRFREAKCCDVDGNHYAAHLVRDPTSGADGCCLRCGHPVY